MLDHLSSPIAVTTKVLVAILDLVAILNILIRLLKCYYIPFRPCTYFHVPTNLIDLFNLFLNRDKSIFSYFGGHFGLGRHFGIL